MHVLMADNMSNNIKYILRNDMGNSEWLGQHTAQAVTAAAMLMYKSRVKDGAPTGEAGCLYATCVPYAVTLECKLSLRGFFWH